MKDAEYDRWRAAQENRMVVTGGKTFVADDDVVTAVLCPMPGRQEFLDLAAHELIEMASLCSDVKDGWEAPHDPDEADGLTLFDEYRNERVRQEIRDRLDWPEGRLDASPGLAPMATEIADRMPDTRLDPPPPDLWGAWLHFAQVWAMVQGRAAAGSESAERSLAEWRHHKFALDEGWNPVAEAMNAIYMRPHLERDQVAAQAGAIRRQVLDYGRRAWREGP